MFKKGKMILKNRKKYSLKLAFYLLIIYGVFALTYYSAIKNNQNINNENFVKFILKGGNISNLNDMKLSTIVGKTMNYIFKIDFSSPTSILKFGGLDGAENKKLQYNDDYSDLEKLKEISTYIEDPYPSDSNNPIIYLYNSHQLENYSNNSLEIYGITPNVLMTTYLFKEKLNNNGISTVAETANMTELLSINGWDHSYSYKASRLLLLEKINKYNSLKYFIDIHRDSVSKEVSTAKIGDKDYARILFVIGLEHPGYEKNLTLATNINNLINKYYPNLSRGIYKKEGSGVDGIYNQDVSSGCMLIEVGSKDNNINEVMNTTSALTDIFSKYIKGER